MILPPTLDAAALAQLLPLAAGQIADAPCRAVVPARACSATHFADRFFERRTRVMTRADESPKTPRTNSSGRKPANRYASRRRLRLRMSFLQNSRMRWFQRGTSHPRMRFFAIQAKFCALPV